MKKLLVINLRNPEESFYTQHPDKIGTYMLGRSIITHRFFSVDEDYKIEPINPSTAEVTQLQHEILEALK